MKTTFRALGLLTLSALGSGCSEREPQPSRSDIQQAFAGILPAFASVGSFRVEAMQNVGTTVEPLWHSRFRATVRVNAPTYVEDGHDQGVVFLRAVKERGEATDFFGKAVSRLYAGAWRTQVELEGQSLGSLGRPTAAFGSGRAIVRGSKDEADWHAQEAERRRLAVLAEEREAEERRMAAERAAEARRQMLANANRLFVGTWRNSAQALFEFRDDGTYRAETGGANGRIITGTWRINGDALVLQALTLTLAGRTERPNAAPEQIRIVHIGAGTYELQSLTGSTRWTATRIR